LISHFGLPWSFWPPIFDRRNIFSVSNTRRFWHLDVDLIFFIPRFFFFYIYDFSKYRLSAGAAGHVQKEPQLGGGFCRVAVG